MWTTSPPQHVARCCHQRPAQWLETIEHLMAALAGLQVDNCLIEVDSIERFLPSMDPVCRFAKRFWRQVWLQQANVRKCMEIEESQGVNDRAGEQWIEVIPAYDGVSTADYRLDYGTQSSLVSQSFSVELTPEAFLRDIAAARTFVLEDEVAALRQLGFGRHLTGRDLIVFDADGLCHR
jgi:UDP-3-O-[3-hydroxymyristoyl] N-acetylglucosamine deacetylase